MTRLTSENLGKFFEGMTMGLNEEEVKVDYHDRVPANVQEVEFPFCWYYVRH